MMLRSIPTSELHVIVRVYIYITLQRHQPKAISVLGLRSRRSSVGDT